MKPVGPEQIRDTHGHDYIALRVGKLKKYKRMKLLTRAAAIFIFSLTLFYCKKPRPSLTSYIDIDIGGVGHLLQPTRPTVQLPNQMVRMYPVRKDYLDDQISWFPMSTISHRQGELFGLKPVNGKVAREKWDLRMSYDHDLEVKHPWYYSAWLIDDEIHVEYTPGEKSGMYRIEFGSNDFSLLFKTLQSGELTMRDGQVLEGVEAFRGMKAFVYGVVQSKGSTHSENIGAPKKIGLASYSNVESGSNVVLFKYGFSFISMDQARENLEKEIEGWDFEALRTRGRQAWESRVDQIKVEGGTEAQRRTFYTALYRTYERMIDINEYGQYYSAYDHTTHEDDRAFYVDDWVWDTYLAHHPLRMILNPAQEADMLQSYTLMYRQSGWMPQFPLSFGDNPAMNGFHSTIVFLDAWRKGIRNFDVELAYEGMRKNATSATMLPWRNGPNCSLDSFYYERGFYPALHPGEEETVDLVHSFEKRQSVAITLGHSYDDWALAHMAKELGKENDYEFFLPRATNYKNLYQPDNGLMMPKDADGNWIEIDPKFDGGMGGRDYYDENNGFTYAWQVQHDVPGLMDLMGGRRAFENNLDRLFREDLDRSKYQFWAKFPDATGLVGQFSMGNEPSFHIPYLYNFTESPWKTQQRIRFLLDVWYKDNIFGIPGDEDGGGMTAFVVFSMMGFYPLTPGIPWYTVGSPVFEHITIDLPNGNRFSVIAQNASPVNKYIQSAEFNGIEMEIPWFSHEDLVAGGTLKLVMGPKPNKELWKNSEAGFLYN
ncbi:MAG: GH92 family glycosyl hydrolase [Cytophagales bacterium]|nr:GH92 family glycosyl hydrolase [Cytophagales bacterium]